MKLQNLKTFFVFLIVLLAVYIFFVHTGLMAISDVVGVDYRSPDEEINFISALHTLGGEGPYKSVNHVYPPGRFIALSSLFKILGTSVPTLGLYFILLPTAFFPTFLFFISYELFRKYKSTSFSLALATFATLIYLFFIYSAQDVHVFTALFFIVLLKDFRSERRKNISLGILLGIVFLFRIEAGVFLLLSAAITLFKKRKNFRKLSPVLLGFLSVWVPVLIYLIFTGSLKNFISDTIYPGIIAQPKLIDSPIPTTLEAVFLAIIIFLFSATLSLYIKSRDQIGLRIFALFSLLSFAGALVRSDEGHLWYGAVWLPVYISYLISQLSSLKNFFKSKIVPLIVPVGFAFFALGYFLIRIKSASVFIMAAVIVFWFFSKRIKKDYAFLVLISGVMTSLIVFHSLAFVRLRFTGLPKVSLQKSFSPGLFKPEADEIHGLKFSQSDMDTLRKIKGDLDKESKWLFIYPNHTLLYEYFRLKNPTRYYYFAIGTTDQMEAEIIRDLEKTKTINFLLFSDQRTDNQNIKQWILKRTSVEQTYVLGNAKVELRKRK